MESVLKEFGLSNNETKVYVTLLKQKQVTASALAKCAKINRSTAYAELDSLVVKGLASYVVKDAKRFYTASSPEKLLEILELKKERVKSILPQLNALHEIPTSAQIEVFEGIEGVKTFYGDVLRNATDVCAFGVTGNATEMLTFAYPHFVTKFVKANISERAIANFDAKVKLKKHPRSHLKVKYMKKGKSADVTTILYANKVAIQSLIKDNIYVVLINDSFLYNSYKTYFEFMWEML